MKCLLIEALPTTARGTTNCSEQRLEVAEKVRHCVNVVPSAAVCLFFPLVQEIADARKALKQLRC